MDLTALSDVQKKAVTAVDGAVLVLAGAGSGKTTVLTKRVAYLIEEKNTDPYNILAITFTNKAAEEMKQRIKNTVNCDVSKMVISTFHSMCARFLRMDADKLGYNGSFTIYDTDAALQIIKKILQSHNIDTKIMTPKSCAANISAAKNAHAKTSAAEVFYDRCGFYADKMIDIYDEYNKKLKNENAMDFDDLLLNMLRLLKENEQARRYYQNRFKYVMVDEYQDTNSVQYQLVKILSGGYGNLFVVGDDDQSIYAWRGADVRNILDFEKDYPDTKVIKLEQNYRSHTKILDAANAVIKKANERKDKTLWSSRNSGELPKVFCAPDEYREAEFIARKIAQMKEDGRAYSDFAVLYRMHTQSRAIEEKMRTYGIPYRIYGGISFYDRKEIKDILAYLYIIDNPDADTSLLRIINVPKRGIGDATIEKLTAYAANNGISLLDAIFASDGFISGAAAVRLDTFKKCYSRMIDCADEASSIAELIRNVYEITGYRDMVEAVNDADSQARAEHIEELMNSAEGFEETNEDANLTDFLSNIALITSMDTTGDDGTVTLMTLHSAKGLEFDTVFMAGMEEMVFPSQRSVTEDKLDEERRLCYVGITRAKENLFMSHCEQRHMYDGIRRSLPSRFLDDIPDRMIEQLNKKPEQARNYERTAVSQNSSPAPRRPIVNFDNKVQEKDISKFRTGMTVEHPKFGKGQILSMSKVGANTVAVVAFSDSERKMFLEFAPLKIC